ncbi:MAG TPA: hypothetical protein ENK25_01405 [Bacteroidetes bacterium]|nr:hypothetical protein [Bacteroidota bacterium]
MIRLLRLFIFIVFVHAISCTPVFQKPIDRKRVVERHNIISDKLDVKSPAQVGNGEFSFSVDITGLQTYVPFNTMSHWGWHSDPLPKEIKVENFKGQMVNTYGRMVRYPLVNNENEEQRFLSHWLAGNPHRINLGRIAFSLKKDDGNLASSKDLQNCRQEVNLWTGIISSYFEIEGIPVNVKTACHPARDLIAVSVESELIENGGLSVTLEFPYASANNSRGGDYIGIWDQPSSHQTQVSRNANRVDFFRTLDDDKYYVSLKWFTKSHFENDDNNPHKFELIPTNKKILQFVCEFSSTEITEDLLSVEECLEASKRGWAEYWNTGAAIDLSESTDPRWMELERRIVLSQYLMKVNEAGSLPPQESGLVNNGWYGRFHFEMIWWHGVHWALWDRWEQWDKSLQIYNRFLKTAKERAKNEGFKGARWPKCTAYNNSEWPHPCHAFLIWQQPHPLYFAELDYRLHPDKHTLEKWKDIVFNTADFLVSVAHYDSIKQQYVLGPPLIPVSENVEYWETLNPTFELSYWRFGLKVAKDWYQRCGLESPDIMEDVLQKLAPLPVENDLYVLYEGVQNMWTKYNFEHPALIGTYGMLPGDGVDVEILENTYNKIRSVWKFEKTWGWDFPMLAMTAARLNRPEEAIDFLLHENFGFDQHGLAYSMIGPFPYFPANGGLLTAVAMMAGGWDGAENANAPGFPKNGKWKIKYEKFNIMP